VWAGASSRGVVALAVVLAAGACNEPLGPPTEKKGSDPITTEIKGSDPITPPPEIKGSDPITPPPEIKGSDPIMPPIDAAPAVTLYRVVDALADARSSPLTRVGMGDWHGNFSIKGCIYRNDRVFVVDVYCTYKEQPAFSVVIISPEKGEVVVYAEADTAISTIDRSKYFSFYAESHLPPAELAVPSIKDATFDDVNAWQEKLYNARIGLPGIAACSTGSPSCPEDPAWDQAARAFVAAPNDDWPWIIDQLRNRAHHSGKYVAKKGGPK
jgi:hypothetical protein